MLFSARVIWRIVVRGAVTESTPVCLSAAHCEGCPSLLHSLELCVKRKCESRFLELHVSDGSHLRTKHHCIKCVHCLWILHSCWSINKCKILCQEATLRSGLRKYMFSKYLDYCLYGASHVCRLVLIGIVL